MNRTYLDACLKEGRTARWPDSAMPVRVYIAPFRWYEQSKQQESYAYNQMVMEALQRWQDVSNNVIRFQLVQRLQDSQIDIHWRRVDRKSLGHCKYMINDRSMVYSSEIEIGISDGVLHAQYNAMDEVRHTILHEIGHALGLLDHSDHQEDIMYVPHQYGVVDISARDILTLQWLYKLPVGFYYPAIGKKYNLPEPFTLHDVLDQIEGKSGRNQMDDPFLKKANPRVYTEQPERLAAQHEILSSMGKFYLQTQNIRIPTEDRDRLIIDKLRQEELKKRRPSDDHT